MSTKYQLSKHEDRPTPRVAIILITLLVITMLGLMGLRFLKAPFENLRTDTFNPNVETMKIDPSQDMVISVDNYSVVVPKDATSRAGSISITPREPNLYSYAGTADWTRPYVIDVHYKDATGVTREGMTFTKPILICFKLSAEQWTDYNQRPTEYLVQYYDDKQSPPAWTNLPTTAYPENNYLCGQVEHLSTFALAVKVQASIPFTGGIVPIPSVVSPTFPSSQDTNPPHRPDDPTQPVPTPVPPTPQPTESPTQEPTIPPTTPPTIEPTLAPTESPTETPPPTDAPTNNAPTSDTPGKPTKKPKP